MVHGSSWEIRGARIDACGVQDRRRIHSYLNGFLTGGSVEVSSDYCDDPNKARLFGNDQMDNVYEYGNSPDNPAISVLYGPKYQAAYPHNLSPPEVRCLVVLNSKTKKSQYFPPAFRPINFTSYVLRDESRDSNIKFTGYSSPSRELTKNLKPLKQGQPNKSEENTHSPTDIVESLKRGVHVLV